MKSLGDRILEYLLPLGEDVYTDISTFLQTMSQSKDTLEYANTAIDALNRLKTKSYIDFGITTSVNGRVLPTHGGNFPLSNYTVKACIKEAGINYLEKKEKEIKADLLTTAQTKDIPVNTKFRKWGYYVALAGVIVLLLLWLIDKLGKK